MPTSIADHDVVEDIHAVKYRKQDREGDMNGLPTRTNGGVRGVNYYCRPADVIVAAQLVLIDHKCLGGTLAEALASALSSGAQLAAYVAALERATGRDVLGRWLHLPLQGVCVEVR